MTGSRSPLDDLNRRLDALRERRRVETADKDGGAVPKNAMGIAFRIGVELVAGLVVGGGIGWLLDSWLGTSPFLLIVFFFLGAAAGMLNVWRAVKHLNQPDGPQG
jgi:ATP synthase protein I